MVKLERLMKKYNLPCELYAKCEFFNAGGSVKDRIGLRMIEEAERSGKLKPGDTLIEATSGNTGVGLCAVAAIKGYKVIITMPEKMSAEKVNMMKCLGAEIIRSPDDAPWNSPESHIGLALKLQKQIPNSHILDQYKNPANPLAHYEGTGSEIVEQLDRNVHAVIIAAGTGGTLTGIARKIKDEIPECKVIAIDPVGSILAQPDALNDHKRLQPYQVEGIGYDFIPTVLDREIVDEWVKIDDPEALTCFRDLVRHEALLCGSSSGTNLAGCLKWIRSQPREALVGKKIVTILPDGSRNYMSKFLDDNWMMDKGFIGYDECVQSKQNWSNFPLSDCIKISQVIAVTPKESVSQVSRKLGAGVMECVVLDDGILKGTVSETQLLNALACAKVAPDSPVGMIMNKKPKQIDLNTPMGHVAKMMEIYESVLVKYERGIGVVRRHDVLEFVVREGKENHKPLQLSA